MAALGFCAQNPAIYGGKLCCRFPSGGTNSHVLVGWTASITLAATAQGFITRSVVVKLGALRCRNSCSGDSQLLSNKLFREKEESMCGCPAPHLSVALSGNDQFSGLMRVGVLCGLCLVIVQRPCGAPMDWLEKMGKASPMAGYRAIAGWEDGKDAKGAVTRPWRRATPDDAYLW